MSAQGAPTGAVAPAASPGLPPPRGPWKILWQRLRTNRIALVGGAILLVLYFASCFAGFLAPYDYNEVNTDTSLYGPMLLGGSEVMEVARHTVEVENDDYEWVEKEVPEYRTRWRWFSGGLTFRSATGNLTWRPHVHALREYQSYDSFGESTSVLGFDPDVRVPLRFFVRTESDHEVASLCGFFPVRARFKLFGVEPAPVPAAGEEAVKPIHEVFLLGSDKTGRDLMTRIFFGGQISLSVGLLGILISMTIGLVFGGISGYYGGFIDLVMMRFTELLMAIPGLYLILTLRYMIRDDISSRKMYLMIVAILALAGWASIGRVIRGMVLSLKENEYSLAARALGASDGRVILRHILPNTASFVIVTSTLYVPYYILGEVALSFLGLGISEPETSWGLLLKDAQNSQILKFSPWLVLPGFFIFVAVLAYNFLGDGMRDAADPRAVLGKAKK